MHSRQPSETSSPRYATRAQIARAVQAARANGVPVGSVDVLRDGTIRVGAEPTRRDSSATPSLFDELNAAGRL